MKFTVTAAENGKRLDVLLAEKNSELSRSQAKRLVDQGGATVNGKSVPAHYFLREGEVVESGDVPVARPRIIKAPATETVLAPIIIAETEEYLVIDKPSGLLVHPTQRHETATLASWLVSRYPSIAEVGDDPIRPGIVHRLDQDVSGVMVIAKTQLAFTHLKQQFQKRKVEKQYSALVYGTISTDGEIDLPIGRSADGKFVAHPRRFGSSLQSTDRSAVTRYQVRQQVKNYTLLAVMILTGRTHQIRAHLVAIGHPIVGDKLYGPRHSIFHALHRRVKVMDPGRIFLHAERLAFTDRQRERHEFTAPLPNQLTTFLDELNKQ